MSEVMSLPLQDDEQLVLNMPRQILEALQNNEKIRDWLAYIEHEYDPTESELYSSEETEILLLYPCSYEKPYKESQSYRALSSTLNDVGLDTRLFDSIEEADKSQKIHIITVSEPYGLVPEEFQKGEISAYDCPGLFKWWCDKNNYDFDREAQDEAIQIIGGSIGGFFRRMIDQDWYDHVIPFIRTYTSGLNRSSDHTHRRMLEYAISEADASIDLYPTKNMVEEVTQERNSFAWDMQGVAHPIVQEYLKDLLTAHNNP